MLHIQKEASNVGIILGVGSLFILLNKVELNQAKSKLITLYALMGGDKKEKERESFSCFQLGLAITQQEALTTDSWLSGKVHS